METLVECLDTERKRGAVCVRDELTTIKCSFCIQIHHCYSKVGKSFSISLATTSPDISEGGTPGPGTVSCPV